MPKVSVLMAYYSKTGEYLYEAVQSVLKQDYSDLELIVVDDCSPVPASKMLTELESDPRLKIVTLPVNAGMANAINQGIALAQSDVVAFIDHDDVWEQNKLSHQLQFVSDKLFDQGFVIHCQAYINENGVVYVTPERGMLPGEHVSEYLFCNPGYIQTSGLMIDRNSLLKVGGMGAFKRHTDYELILKLFNIGVEFKFLSLPLYTYRVIRKINNYKDSIEWLKCNEHYFSEKGVEGFKIKVILASMFNNGLSGAFLYALKHGLYVAYFRTLFRFFLKSVLPHRLQLGIVKIKHML